MTETNPFFRWVFRLAGLALLALLLFLAYVAGSEVWHQLRRGAAPKIKIEQTDADGRTRELNLRFGSLHAIPGTDAHLLELESDADDGKDFSSGSGGSETRNLIFFDAGYGQARWLFANNDSVIGDWSLLRYPDEETPVRAIFLLVHASDSDSDGRIGAADAGTPALLHADGRGYTRLSAPVERVLDSEVDPVADQLGLLIQNQGKIHYRRYRLQDFKLVSDRQLADLRAQ